MTDRHADPRLDPAVEAVLADRIAPLPGRDPALVRARLIDVLEAAGFGADDRIELAVDGPLALTPRLLGLTDLDAIVIVDDPDGSIPPWAAAVALAERLRSEARADDLVRVEAGHVVVAPAEGGGFEARLLPAVRTVDDVRMADHQGMAWFGIGPAFFASTLRAEDARHHHRLIPVIRLAKQVVAADPELRPLSGYHVETLAIAALRGYDGPMAYAPMLERLFAGAAEAVRRPLVNAAGSSLHIDDDLGPANGPERRRIAGTLTACAGRIAAQPVEAAWSRRPSG